MVQYSIIFHESNKSHYKVDNHITDINTLFSSKSLSKH